MLQRLCLGVSILATAGCGGASSAGKATQGQLETTIVQLESSTRRDRHKMRDLENELHLLKGKLRSAQREQALVVRLPVEIREPEPAPGTASEPETVMFDEDGVEIVYVGDAAADRSVAPRLPPEMSSAAPTLAPARSIEPQRRASEVHVPPVHDDERIEVTSQVGPTVARQLREARVPVQPARNQPAAAFVGPERAVAKPRASTSTARQTADAADPRAQYQRYLEALRAGNHMYAIAGFRNFIERFPAHQYADNARYWLAEAFYDRREYRVALAEFRKVVSDYPQGNKVPDAMLKIGYCHQSLGELDEARAALRQVVLGYPNSAPARLAAERLEALSQN